MALIVELQGSNSMTFKTFERWSYIAAASVNVDYCPFLVVSSKPRLQVSQILQVHHIPLFPNSSLAHLCWEISCSSCLQRQSPDHMKSSVVLNYGLPFQENDELEF